MEQDSATVMDQTGITTAEREFAERYLAATRDCLADALKDLSEAQWNFKASPERWSIAETMEHIAIVEGRVKDIVGGMAQAPADSPDRNVKLADAVVLVKVPMRYPKVKAPERISPIGSRTGRQALEDFLASRARTAELLRTSAHLRGRVVPHPILGPWDGYQWILGAAGHSARHTGQILEVIEDSKYPR